MSSESRWISESSDSAVWLDFYCTTKRTKSTKGWRAGYGSPSGDRGEGSELDGGFAQVNYNFASEKEALLALKGEDRTRAATAEAYLWSMWCRSGDAEVDRSFRAGVKAMQRGDLSAAEDIFTRIIERAPGFAEAWNKRATVRFVMKNFSGSIADCQETIARNPEHFGACSGQGLCHMSLGEYHEAAICFRRALDIHPHLYAVRHNLALAEAEDFEGSKQLH
jgi:tetratricopeptide (TPR) repeat protein